MAGAIGGLLGLGSGSGILGGLFSGGSVLGGLLSSLSSAFGSNNILGAVTNLLTGTIGDLLKVAIDASPLPDFMKDMAKDLVDDVIADSRQDTTPEAEEAVKNSPVMDAIQQIAEGMAKKMTEEADDSYEKGENWLVALAKSLGKTQNELSSKMIAASKTMSENTGTGEEEKAVFFEANAEFTAFSQMFTLSSNQTSTSLKSIGEGLAAMARKQ